MSEAIRKEKCLSIILNISGRKSKYDAFNKISQISNQFFKIKIVQYSGNRYRPGILIILPNYIINDVMLHMQLLTLFISIRQNEFEKILLRKLSSKDNFIQTLLVITVVCYFPLFLFFNVYQRLFFLNKLHFVDLIILEYVYIRRINSLRNFIIICM